MDFEILDGASKGGGGGKDIKKLFKDKKFLIIAGIVCVLALVYGYMKNRRSSGTTGESVAYMTYPTGAEGSGDSLGDYYASYYEGVLSENNSYYESMISDLNSAYALDMDEMNSNITSLSDRLTSAEDLVSAQSTAIERQNVISQMRANSELYNNITDESTKKALHDENTALADAMGWKFDSTSGNWFEGNSVVYTTAQQTATDLAKKTASSGTVSFDSNTDYQAKINEAIMSGASATTINDLNAQRNAKLSASGKTNAAVGYDKNTDYQALINKAKETGADQSVIDNLTAQRNQKIADMQKA